MSNTVSFSTTGGASNIPSASEMNGFAKGLESKDTGDLLKGLNDPHTEPWQKDAIANELANRAAKSPDAQSSGDSQDDIQKLLKKLMDGSISPDELKKLAGMLGVPPDALQALKGQGEASGVGGGGSDISGG